MLSQALATAFKKANLSVCQGLSALGEGIIGVEAELFFFPANSLLLAGPRGCVGLPRHDEIRYHFVDPGDLVD